LSACMRADCGCGCILVIFGGGGTSPVGVKVETLESGELPDLPQTHQLVTLLCATVESQPHPTPPHPMVHTSISSSARLGSAAKAGGN